MTYFSENPELVIGENYTRGMLCDLMDINYCKDEIEKGMYKCSKFSSIFIFSTINNYWNYYNIKMNDSLFLFSGNGERKDQLLIQHKAMNCELLLFIRMCEETGFYYFGRCEFVDEYKLKGYDLPLYGLELKDTKLNIVQEINIPTE